jgi:hypothetical protein
MDFMEIDYGKEHNYPWCRNLSIAPPGIDKIWIEPKEVRNFQGHEYNFHPYAPEVFDVADGTKLVIDCMQNFKYIDDKKEDIRKWFAIKPERVKEYEQIAKFYDGIELDYNTCVINVRGGEYVGVKDFNLPRQYWNDAVDIMLRRNSKMKFIVVTDDIGYSKSILPFPVVHFSIGADYFILNQAKNLIISNSSFALFPTWLNPFDPFVIAPHCFARYNLGVQAHSEINRPDWAWMNREGRIV